MPPDEADRVRLFRQLMASSAMLRHRMDRALAPSGLTTQQAALMQFIEHQAEPPTLGQAAADLGMSHQNAKQIGQVLVRKGWLAIVVCPRDRRARRLVPTEQHRQFWQARNPGDFAAVRDWTAGLGDAEVAQAVRLLDRLIGGLISPSTGGAVPASAARDAAGDEGAQLSRPSRPRP